MPIRTVALGARAFPMNDDVYDGPQELVRAARRALVFR